LSPESLHIIDENPQKYPQVVHALFASSNLPEQMQKYCDVAAMLSLAKFAREITVIQATRAKTGFVGLQTQPDA
jgi:hypothetical protein